MAGVKTAPEVLLKTVDEVVLADFDFAANMASTETISTFVSLTITPSGAGHLVKDAHVISGQKVQLRLSAGILNTSYSLDLKVTTSLLQTLEGCGFMKVKAC